MLNINCFGQNEPSQTDERCPCRDCIAEGEPPGFPDCATERGKSEGFVAQSYEALDEMKLVWSAMNPLDGGDYGNCVHCCAPIDSIRRTALPFVVLCVDCAEDEGRLARCLLRR